MNIGQAARASGVSAKMIRYYEQVGLIAPAHRADNGYRRYGDEDVHTLRFIRRTRDLGFSVAEIHTLLSLWRDPARQSAEVRQIALKHIADLQGRITQLQDMAASLQALVDGCAGDERPSCPILSVLAAQDHIQG